jgi:hypothetical protein
VGEEGMKVFNSTIDRIFVKWFVRKILGFDDINSLVQWLLGLSITARTLKIKKLDEYYSTLSVSQKIVVDNAIRIIIASILNRIGVNINIDDVVIKITSSKKDNKNENIGENR